MDMEKAALYCFAELERAKGGGLVLKKPEEKMVFVAEFCYPLWLIPWSKLNLLFDGLKATKHTLAYSIIPDVKTFMEHAQRSLKTFETFLAFLSDNVNYFQKPSEEKTMIMDALIAEPNFLDEFNLYLSTTAQVETSSSRMVFLQPAIDEQTISSITQELENLELDFRQDTSVLFESMKLINKTTQNFAKAIRGKIKTANEEFSAEIKKQEEIITPEVNRINEEYDEQITKLTKDFEKQLLPLQKEKVKFEKTKAQSLDKIERYNVEAKTCASIKDTAGEKRWKEKVNETKKELSEIQTRIEELEEKIKETEENKSLETFKLRSELESKVKEAKKDLLELEASRDAEIQVHRQEIEKLEGLTSTIIQQLGNILNLREADLANFEKLGVQQSSKSSTLVYVPFYLVCYEAELKKRLVLFSPSAANSIRFTTKLKGALGKTKVKQLLVPRFKTITSLLNKFPRMLERNAAFEREIYEAGEKTNMLKTSSSQDQIKSGLEKLKEEGWLSDKEHAAFMETFQNT
jgi:DNA repair exonuclease SbcCD ATPase subunit